MNDWPGWKFAIIGAILGIIVWAISYCAARADVLLIINGAPVGSIAAQTISYPNFRPGIFEKNDLMRIETAAETCARVMKEMGARKHVPWSGDREDYYVGSVYVLCVPAPTGLAK